MKPIKIRINHENPMILFIMHNKNMHYNFISIYTTQFKIQHIRDKVIQSNAIRFFV